MQPPRPNVLIQYNCIPHYRSRIFELLTADETIDFSIIADSKPDTPFLEVTSNADGRNIRHLHADTRTIKVPFLHTLYWQPGAVKIVRKKKPDVLIVLGSPYSLTAWVLCVLGRLRRLPVFLWGHGLLNSERGPQWWLRRLFYRLASGQLLYGDYAKRLLVKRGFRPESLYVVYNSLDYDLQQKIASEIDKSQCDKFRKSLRISEDERLIVFTGRLQPVKRLELLLEAVAILAGNGRKVHVALIGEGSERGRLAQISRALGIGDLIHFLGASYDERYVGLVYSASDLSVIPSGAGLSIMHALTFGTPVLIHDKVEFHFPEWEAVQNGVTGFSYRYGDTKDMAEKISLALYPTPAKSRMYDDCRKIINDKYNPHYQLTVFRQVVADQVGVK